MHHVREWRKGGGHALENCVLLCGRHHERVHRLNETLVLHADGTVEITYQRHQDYEAILTNVRGFHPHVA